MASKGCKWSGPESVWSCGKGVAFEDLNCVGRYEFQEAKFAEVGDEDEAVLTEVAEGLRLGGEGLEVIVGWLDFHDAALGILEEFRFSCASLAFGLGEETAIGKTCATVTENCGEEDGWLEALAYGIEK